MKRKWWSSHLFLCIPYIHNQTLRPSWITDEVNGQTQFWKGTTQGLFGAKLVPFHPVILTKILKDFSTNQKPITAILDVKNGHRTQFWKRSITSKIVLVVIERKFKIKMWKLTDDWWRVTGKPHLNLWIWWAK